MSRIALYLLLLASRSAVADVYLHHPRGSNNKLNEVSNNRRNANRLFDSQNNGAGGYQVGDDCKPVCSNANGQYDASAEGAGAGALKFYEGSILQVEWTNQHGCGGAQKNVQCDLVLQYMCDDVNPGLRDGNTTETIPDDEAAADNPRYGMHEPRLWYRNCAARERNKGLYIADRNLRGDRQSARHTRQNNNGQRFGFECPEERDYWPYWHPSPWRDIAVFTDDISRCGYYRANSQNGVDKGMCCNVTSPIGECVQTVADTSDREDRHKRGPNTPKACIADTSHAGTWREFGKWHVPPPMCERSPFSRDNHLGNSVPKRDESKGLFATNRAPSFMWQIPHDVLSDGVDSRRCVLRMRYNISTTDFPAWDTDAVSNGDDAPLKNNPAKDFLGLTTRDAELEAEMNTDYPLKLNVNTAQFGRVFEDRSHVFHIRRRPDSLYCKDRTIHNLGVRGRRGNIVQVYPSVEYDFAPTKLKVLEGDCVHFQWTGSDANRAGNAGNGRAMTDRSNLVQVQRRLLATD